MTQADPTLASPAQPEAAEAPHPFAEPAPTPASEGEEMLPVSREEFNALQQDLDQALAKADEHWKLYLGAHAEM